MEDLREKILLHIYKFGPDTPWLMARRLLGNSGWAPSYDESSIEEACRQLEDGGYLVRYEGPLKRSVTSSIKPWLKVKSREMGGKPKGTYYTLTKKGRRLASAMAKGYKNSVDLSKT